MSVSKPPTGVYVLHRSYSLSLELLSFIKAKLHSAEMMKKPIHPHIKWLLRSFSYINTNPWHTNLDCDWVVKPWYAMCVCVCMWCIFWSNCVHNLHGFIHCLKLNRSFLFGSVFSWVAWCHFRLSEMNLRKAILEIL